MSRKIILTGSLLFLGSWIFFLLFSQFPHGYSFDEFHYVPAAKDYLLGKDTPNWEHPPLGKLLMAIGIHLFGDEPFGWRFMSTLFGAATLAGLYFWAWALFRSWSTAVWVALASLVNFFLYVQARTGMLDTFMVAFLIWAFALVTASWDPALPARRVRLYWLFAGFCFGLAVACKWSAVVGWGLALLWLFGVKLLQAARIDLRAAKNEEGWFSPQLWKALGPGSILLSGFVVPVASYLVTFVPLLYAKRTPAYTWLDLFSFQTAMYDGQLRVVTDHPYMSHWLGWPIGLRPIWYIFEKESVGDFVRGVFLIMNPLQMWTSVVALAGVAVAAFTTRSRAAFIIATTWGALFFSWGIIPRKVTFYYYYYPCALVAVFALAWAWIQIERKSLAARNVGARWIFLAACAALFFYFQPILGGFKIPSDEFRKWMWFPNWI